MFLAPDSSWGVTMQRSNLDSSLPGKYLFDRAVMNTENGASAQHNRQSFGNLFGDFHGGARCRGECIPHTLTLHPSEFDTLFGSHWGATINDATPAFCAFLPNPAIDSIDSCGCQYGLQLRNSDGEKARCGGTDFRLAAKEDEVCSIDLKGLTRIFCPTRFIPAPAPSDALARPDITPSEFDTLFGSHWDFNLSIGTAGAEPQLPTSSHDLSPDTSFDLFLNPYGSTSRKHDAEEQL
ncbi:hypothetical protein B0H17DRAFT_1142255 [Mycena rosella]|uniref:Uncharacterized protein n=1 Tax=Mycena rosella TaxID=1033263 RepID=A0AAD7CYA3_MYCRO|nr:hypothetical protein B0H17DRAFT_1142255 [Mycena rosella]